MIDEDEIHYEVIWRSGIEEITTCVGTLEEAREIVQKEVPNNCSWQIIKVSYEKIASGE